MIYTRHTCRQSQRPKRYSVASTLSSPWTVDSETGIVSHGGTPRYQTLLGLEIHAQLDISTKLFSSTVVTSSGGGGYAASHHHNKPNTSVFPFDVAVPGWLPRLSHEAVQAAVLSAAALQCHLPPMSRFERKHYFYADLPLGYQMTQQRWPLAKDGILKCQRQNVKKKKQKSAKQAEQSPYFSVSIDRIQLEQDTGKTIVMTNPRTNQKESLVDFNRAGQALIEIVFAPDLRSPLDAATAVETLRSLLKHIGTCNGKLEEGSLRCDVNVSIAALEEGDAGPDDTQQDLLLERAGNRVEVKNLNSLRQIQEAAKYEALRQAKAATDDNQPTAQETRTFDVKTGQTIVLRTKEGAKDYRFMPEPDLPPLILNEKVLDGMTVDDFIATHLPELPEDARQRLKQDYGLSDYMATVIVGDPPAIAFFDEAVEVALAELSTSSSQMDDVDNGAGKQQKLQVSEAVANLLCNELFALVREFETERLIVEGSLDSSAGGTTSVQYSKVTGNQLGQVVVLLIQEIISNTMAKQLLRVLYEEHDDDDEAATTAANEVVAVREIARNHGFELITDVKVIQEFCLQVLREHPEELNRYKLGGKYAIKMTKFFLGKAMAACQGNAHPERLNEVLRDVLENS